MAAVYVRGKKYWLRYFDPTMKKWRARPTPLRHPEDARKARQLKLETTAAEARRCVQRPRQDERWAGWVADYLRARYGETPTGARYLNAWSHLEGFLALQGITAPAGWRSEHNAAYVDWKEAQDYSREGARWDLGTLGLVMNEAKRRGFIDKNVVSKARIRRGLRGEKPALTNEQIAKIRAGLEKCGEDLRIAFEIALHTGCRLAETSIPLERINLERGTIMFLPKGGRQRMFTVPILFPPFRAWLAALVAQRRREGKDRTCALGTQHSWLFSKLCRRLKISGPEGEKITFHCTRVTFVTRAYEAGLSGEVVRKLVHHADVMVNRLYQRLSIEGLQGLGAKLKIPVVAAPRALRAPSSRRRAKTSCATPTLPSQVASRRPAAARPPAIAARCGRSTRAPQPIPAG